MVLSAQLLAAFIPVLAVWWASCVENSEGLNSGLWSSPPSVQHTLSASEGLRDLMGVLTPPSGSPLAQHTGQVAQGFAGWGLPVAPALLGRENCLAAYGSCLSVQTWDFPSSQNQRHAQECPGS